MLSSASLIYKEKLAKFYCNAEQICTHISARKRTNDIFAKVCIHETGATQLRIELQHIQRSHCMRESPVEGENRARTLSFRTFDDDRIDASSARTRHPRRQ